MFYILPTLRKSWGPTSKISGIMSMVLINFPTFDSDVRRYSFTLQLRLKQILKEINSIWLIIILFAGWEILLNNGYTLRVASH